MKLKIRAMLCLAAVLLLTVSCYEASAEQGGIFRLHVIANSNSPDDQRVKLLVRDAILECESDGLKVSGNADEARTFLMRQGAEVFSTVEAVLKKEGLPYGVQLEMGTYEFPTREYDGSVFPEGSYRALRVVLGEGRGENWWCVMFPPLCVIDTGDLEKSETWKEFERTGTIEFESAVLKLFRYLKEHRTEKWESVFTALSKFFAAKGIA